MSDAIPIKTRSKDADVLVLFGCAVRDRRKARGQSQETFADLCGIDRSYMGGVERGQRNLGLVNILKIITALNVQPSEFFKALDKPAAKTRKSSSG